MKKKMSNADRIIRLAISALIAFFYFTNVITGTLGLVLIVLAGIFLVTSLIGFCPLYKLIGISTKK